MQVATEILNQLGGKKFIAMVGAKNIVADKNAVQFSIGSGAKNKINKVRVELSPADDYSISFWSIRGADVKKVTECNGVYAENLRDVFTESTGFYTNL